MRYKGQYRLKTEIDKKTKMFPREYTGQFADNDVYIDCQKGVRIHHYGKSILEAYIPSLQRGHNIIKAIKEQFQEEIIFRIEESDEEVLFRFHSKYMKDLEPILKPKTSGASISPFSHRNLSHNKNYIIPDGENFKYKEIVQKIGKKRIIELTHITNDFLKSLVTKKNTLEMIKSDMALKGLKGKEYIHSIGKWDEYIKYINKKIGVVTK